MEANTHNPYEWIKKKIEYWKAKSREASEAADMEAFDHAERELANYQAMLKIKY
ncbi:hypothetical protein ACTHSM_05925 [Neisseria sp. P0009.S001]|jgi:hypothetical protein|uniref:hypothetical protein n=1 Tax=unclassified Neisseria TaxID=2623750 RepID=UPI00205DB22B|nr:MAG TPA: hypothetical protein [Caudoviricetes sp.]